ncbi:MAG: DUF4157 domain-containing protein [Rhodospirillaceae bacterium]|nr:DUF4157 domain-containing protein [Rhodospirillaceae bacterium]
MQRIQPTHLASRRSHPAGSTPLPPGLRASLEARFAASLDAVRLHRGNTAAAVAGLLGADAVAVGCHILLSADLAAVADPGDRAVRLLAHEICHTLQGRRPGPLHLEPPGSPAEREAERVARRVARGLAAGPIRQRHAGIACNTWTADRIIYELSYAANDWAVTADEEIEILGLVRRDSNFDKTVNDLDSEDMLDALVSRVDDSENRIKLIQMSGAKLTTRAAFDKMLKQIKIMMFDEGEMFMGFNYAQTFTFSFEMHQGMRAMGGLGTSTALDPKHYKKLFGAADQPFSGVGATGVNPHSLSIGVTDKYKLARGEKNYPKVYQKYSNPIPGSLPDYLRTLTPRQRKDQALVLMKQAIVTSMPHSYVNGLPTRADIAKLAGKKHNLEPALIAGFMLAEQRDQSKNEDAKDLTAALSIMEGNTSIGLGQVVVSTARKNELFRDLLWPATWGALSHKDIAHLLVCDEFNIFATARYIRKVADAATKLDIGKLPNTKAKFPLINLPAYAKHSKDWPVHNIMALGSEYTSTAWDDTLSPGWGGFVYEAYGDVLAAAIF